MPAIWIIAAIAGGAGFVLGKGIDGVGSTVKWVVIGGVGYVAYKHFKG